MKKLLFLVGLVVQAQVTLNPFTGQFDFKGSSSGGGGQAPYEATVTAQVTLTVTAATHAQGTSPGPSCLDGASSPWTGGNCAFTVATNGDVVFTWSPAFTGKVRIAGGGGAATGGVNSGTAGNLGYYASTGTTISQLATAAGITNWLTTPSSALLATAVTDETGSGSLVFATSPTLVTPILGTPTSGTLTNATGLPISTGVSGLGTGVATFLATPSSANLAAAVTGETGSGALVFGTSPALTTPDIGTPSAGVATNITGLPIATGVSGLGTGIATFLATPSSANLIAAVTNETGTGALVFATSPTFVTPLLGTPTSGVATNITGLPLATGVTGTLPVANGGTGLTAGTSGGVLAYTATGTLASSGALTANLPVIGGGAGAAPSVGTRSGNTTAYVTTTGTQTSGRCVEIDANGNHIQSAAGCASGAGTVTVVGAGALTSTALVTGGGTTTLQTPAATATMDSSGNISTPGSMSTGVGGSVGGTVEYVQGTAPSLGTTSIKEYAPTSVTSYAVVKAGAAATGYLLRTNSANVMTETMVAGSGSGSVCLTTSCSMTTPILGTPTSGTLTNATGLPISTGVSGMGTGVGTFLATPSSANLLAAITNETGTGVAVFNDTPTLIAPLLGTPTSGVMTNVTGTATGLTSGITNALKSASTTVDVSAATAPSSGQVLTATGTTTATWQTPVTGSGTVNSGTSGNLARYASTGTAVSELSTGAGVATFITTPSSANLLAALTDETGTGVAVFGTSPTITTPVLTGLPTGSGVASAATASTLASRDANANLTANNQIAGYTTTATAAGTTTLTVGSTRLQFFTGSTTQTVTLPVTSTMVLGQQFVIGNNATGLVTVTSSGANNVKILGAGASAIFTVILTSGTSAASWDAFYNGDVVATGKVLTTSNSLTLAGTDATVMTFPTTSATIARTDAANTFTGVQTFSTRIAAGSLQPRVFGVAVGDPAGSALATGVLGYVVSPMACTVAGWDIVVDAGTATVDVWKIAAGTAKPTVANTITASAKPAIATGTAIESTTLTSWTTSVTAGDIFGFNLDTVATAKYITVDVRCQ